MKKYFKKVKWTIAQSFLFYGMYSLTLSLFPLMSQRFFDHYEKGVTYLGSLLFFFFLLVLVNLLMEYANRVWEWRLSKELAILLKADLFLAYISQRHQDFEKNKVVDYLSALNNNVAVVDEDYFSATIDLVKSVLKLVIFTFSMLYVLNWQLTLIILAFSLITSYLPQLTQEKLAGLR